MINGVFVVGKTLGNGMYVIRGCCNSGSFFSITAERSTPIDVIYIFVSYCCDQSDANGPEELSFSLGFHQTPTCRPRRKQSRDNRLSVIGTGGIFTVMYEEWCVYVEANKHLSSPTVRGLVYLFTFYRCRHTAVPCFLSGH